MMTERKDFFVDAVAEYVHSRRLFLGPGSENGLMGVVQLLEEQTADKRYEFIAGIGMLDSFTDTFSSPLPLWRFPFDSDEPHFDALAYSVSQLGELKRNLRDHETFPISSELYYSSQKPYLSLVSDTVSSPERLQQQRSKLLFQRVRQAADGVPHG